LSQQVYNFKLDLSLGLMKTLNQIDRFDAGWATLERRQSSSLKHLRTIATVKSVGASTRIEGANMTDAEVEVLLNDLNIHKLEERDQQEVAGYYQLLDRIVDEHKNISVKESDIKTLHKMLLVHSNDEEWHRGNYKQSPNSLEETRPDGTKRTIYKTTAPGIATDEAMRQLLNWWRDEKELIPVIRIAVFIYEFLSIHPFQDGNGRLSRLLTTLLMLKQGYSWIQYVSFEHEIENRKREYYKVLMQTQKNRPGENITAWIEFFTSCLLNIQQKLEEKMKTPEAAENLSKTQQNILHYLELHPGSKTSQIAGKLQVAVPTVKKILMNMLDQNLIARTGAGKSTSYWNESRDVEQKNLMFTLSANQKDYQFELMKPINNIKIHRVVLVPNFEWHAPTEWAERVSKSNLHFRIHGEFKNGSFSSHRYILGWISPFHYQPVFDLQPALEIPGNHLDKQIFNNQYPIRITIELLADGSLDEFKVHFVYDAIL
jgi:Fic family protein